MKIRKNGFSVNELLKTTKLHILSSNETEKILKVAEKAGSCSIQFDHANGLSSNNYSDSSKRTKRFASPDPVKINLVNLSYSQPSTPRTPFLKPFPCATPSVNNNKRSYSCFGLTPMIKSNFGGIPSTPMLNESLRVVSSALNGVMNKQLDFPDILELIDDDQKPFEFVDKEVKKYTEVNLCDKTVVDYLLDLNKDYQFTAPIKSPVVSAQEATERSPQIRRKCRRAKPVIFVESEVYKEDKRKRAQEQRRRRKERMKKQSLGTRRSLRITSHRVKYKY